MLLLNGPALEGEVLLAPAQADEVKAAVFAPVAEATQMKQEPHPTARVEVFGMPEIQVHSETARAMREEMVAPGECSRDEARPAIAAAERACSEKRSDPLTDRTRSGEIDQTAATLWTAHRHASSSYTGYREGMDVVVAGGGIIGLATAWRLAQHGLRVAVWDAGRVGAEASWAGAGMLAPGGELEAKSWWSDLALDSLRQYPEFVRELEREAGVRIDYRACGALEYAFDDAEWQGLTERARIQSEWGIRSEDAGEHRLFYPDDAAVDPRHLVNALRTCCVRRGVVLREEQPVREIRVEAGRVVVPEHASAAILAAGAWSGGIAIQVEGTLLRTQPSVPVRGHLISFAAGSGRPGPIVRHGHTYILERSSGLTIAGSTTERIGFNRTADPALVEEIRRRAAKLMPRLEGMAVTGAWVGFRPGTESGEPQLGQLADSPVFLAYGHYRNGILMAPASAMRLSREITANLGTGSFSPAGHH